VECQTCDEGTAGFSVRFLSCQNGNEIRLVKSVESFDQKVGLDSLLLTEKRAVERELTHYKKPGSGNPVRANDVKSKDVTGLSDPA